MPNYRRWYGEGGTFAFTVCLADRSQTTLTDEIAIIKRAYADTLTPRGIRTLALCVMPNHLHAVWRMADGDTNYPGAWQGFKRRVTNRLSQRIWQDRYYESMIETDAQLTHAVNYVHGNPVHHGYVRDAADWPHSTWHRWKHERGPRFTNSE